MCNSNVTTPTFVEALKFLIILLSQHLLSLHTCTHMHTSAVVNHKLMACLPISLDPRKDIIDSKDA